MISDGHAARPINDDASQLPLLWRCLGCRHATPHHASLITVSDTSSHLSRLLSTRLFVSLCGRHLFYSHDAVVSLRPSVCLFSTDVSVSYRHDARPSTQQQPAVGLLAVHLISLMPCQSLPVHSVCRLQNDPF